MKTYTYIARDKNGAPVRGSLPAADRQAALAELKARELVPLVVEEGAAPAPGGSGFDWRTPAVWVAGLAVLGLGVWIALKTAPARKPAAAARKPAPAAPVQPLAKPAPPAVKPAPAARTERPPAVAPTPVVAPAPAPASPLLASVEPPRTNALALHRPADQPRVLVPGLRRNVDTNAPNPYATFKTKSERMMSQMLAAKPGEALVGIQVGRDFNDDFLKALQNTIEIYPTDTPEMAEHKENVAWMKEEMKRLVKEGRTPEEILTAYREQHNEVARFRTDLQRQLGALKKEGKMQEAEAFVKEANKMLEPYGTRPLTLVPVLPVRKPDK